MNEGVKEYAQKQIFDQQWKMQSYAAGSHDQFYAEEIIGYYHDLPRMYQDYLDEGGRMDIKQFDEMIPDVFTSWRDILTVV